MDDDLRILPSDEPRSSRQRRRTRRTIAASALLLIAGLTITALAGRAPTKSTSSPRAPNVEFVALGDAPGFRLHDLRGKPAVVNFYASWCVFCVVEMPTFQGVYEQVSDRVQFVGIAMQDDPEAAQHLAATTGVTYRLAADPKGTAFERLGARGMPTTLFIDAQGRIRELYGGPLNTEALRQKIHTYFGV